MLPLFIVSAISAPSIRIPQPPKKYINARLHTIIAIHIAMVVPFFISLKIKIKGAFITPAPFKAKKVGDFCPLSFLRVRVTFSVPLSVPRVEPLSSLSFEFLSLLALSALSLLALSSAPLLS